MDPNQLITVQSIQKMDTLHEFDNFIGLLNYFHVSRCEKLTCPRCSFTADLRYFWVSNQNSVDAVSPLQHICRINLE